MQIYIFFVIFEKSCNFAAAFVRWKVVERKAKIIHGKVLEWLKRPAWKASKR